jgi:hypothetical protein
VKAPGSTSTIAITINDGEKGKTVNIDMKAIQVKGQTEGEWIPLGKYHFAPGNKGYVAITGKNADGAVLANAVLFVPER